MSSPGELPCHRGDLEVYQQTRQGESVWVLKDPIALRYFQLSEMEFTIFRWLDGSRGLREIVSLHQQRFAPARLSVAQLRGFVARLYQRGLLLPASYSQADSLWNRRQRAQFVQRLQSVSNPLAIKVPGFDPARLVEWLYAWLKPLFTRTAMVLMSVSITLACLMLIANADQFAVRLPGLNAFFSPFNLLLLSVALAVTKVLHEFAHALTCHHFGARCHEMGLMLLVFTPCLYCDVTDGWKLASRMQRIAISAAGILVELALAAWCAVLWCVTEPGVLNSMLFNVMIVCSIGTLFINANPLLRYDGYYILSDLLDRPNLWQTSRRQLSECLQRCFGLSERERSGQQRRVDWLVAYAAASSLYRFVVLVSIVWLTFNVCSNNGVTVFGYVIVAIVIAGVIATPLHRGYEKLRDPQMRRKLKRPRFLFSVCGLAGVILGVVAVPVPCRVGAPARVQPSNARQVYVSVAGTIMESVVPGTRVKQGDQLAQLENDEVTRKILEVQANIDSQEMRVLHLRSLRNEQASFAARLPAALEMLDDLRKQLTQLELDRAALALRAPVDGTVLEAPSVKPDSANPLDLEGWHGAPTEAQNVGAFLPRQTLFCLVNPSDQFEVELFVDQFSVGLLKVNQRVRLSLASQGGAFLTGDVQEISTAAIETVPVELAAENQVATFEDRQPRLPTYRILVHLDPTTKPLVTGATGIAKVDVSWQPIAAQFYRVAQRTFNLSSF